jgi:asparagine synthase (glutamine-hydrolysing)
MCGITGFVNLRDRAAGTADLRRMMDVIAHRGPDGHGIYEDGTGG